MRRCLNIFVEQHRRDVELLELRLVTYLRRWHRLFFVIRVAILITCHFLWPVSRAARRQRVGIFGPDAPASRGFGILRPDDLDLISDTFRLTSSCFVCLMSTSCLSSLSVSFGFFLCRLSDSLCLLIFGGGLSADDVELLLVDRLRGFRLYTVRVFLSLRVHDLGSSSGHIRGSRV